MNFTTKTASLRAVTADISKLKAKGLDANNISTNNVTTSSINDGDINFVEEEIIIKDKIIKFNPEDENLIPANSVTDEAKEYAKVAQESAVIAEEGASVASAAASAASISETNAANSATSAAESAELLGDAAMKGGDNTFTGNNIFNGALGGVGTLYGLPMASWLGMSHVLGNAELTNAEVKRLFPNHKEMEVVPYLKCSKFDDSYEILFPKLKYGFFELANADYDYATQPNGLPYGAEEIWLYSDTQDMGLYSIAAYGKKTYYIFPNYTAKRAATAFMFGVGAGKGTQHIVAFVPKWERAKIWTTGGSNYTNNCIFELINYPTPFTELTIDRACILTLVNFNLHKCKKVNVTTARLDKASILTILNTLPSYDESTMTTIPTCTMYINEEFEGDEEIKTALLNLQAPVAEGGKGWTIAISGITLTEAATFGLRKIWYVAKEKDDAGKYVDSENQRWSVSAGTVAMRHYEVNESIGYQQFDSLESALTEWGLTEYIEIPNEEQINN